MPWSAVRRLAPVVLGLGAFGLYALAAPAGPYWLDSQELGAAAVRLGVPHPTGFPLFCLLGKIASLVPVGELAFRVHLLSAACAAIAVAQAARLVHDRIEDDRLAALGGVAAGVVLAAGMTFWRQATVTEVYAPTAALLVVAVRLALRSERVHGLSLAIVAGLGAAGLHASFALLLGVPLVVVWIARLRGGARWPLAMPALAAVAAVGVIVYLPLRSASGHVEALDWGHPERLSALVDHLTAERIRAAYGHEMLASTNVRAFWGQVEGDLGVLALLAAAGGATALLARRATRGAGLLLAAIAVGDFLYSVALNPRGIVERQNGVSLALAVSALAGVGVAAGARKLGRAGPYAAGLLAVVLAVEPILGAASERFASRSDAARGWGEAALAQCPPGAIALAQSDSLAANLFWLTLVEGARPDTATIVRQHAWDRERNEALLGPLPAGEPPLAAILALAPRRAVRWEIGVDPAPRPLVPDLPLAAVDATAAWDPRRTAARLRRLLAPAVDDNGRRLAARAWANLGALASGAGDLSTSALASEEALRIAPGHLRARVNAARSRLALGDDAQARAHAEIAARLAPGEAQAWALLGVLDARGGLCGSARAHLQRALALDPNDVDARVNLDKLGGCKDKP